MRRLALALLILAPLGARAALWTDYPLLGQPPGASGTLLYWGGTGTQLYQLPISTLYTYAPYLAALAGKSDTTHAHTGLYLGVAETDHVKDSHLDWGTGAGQISADDLPDGASRRLLTPAEASTWDAAYSHSQATHAATNAYVPGGADVGLGDGGTGASLADPDAHRLWGWDDTLGAVRWWVLGAGLSYDQATATLSASASAPSFGQVTTGTSAAALTVGDGGSLSYAGTGAIDARTLAGVTPGAGGLAVLDDASVAAVRGTLQLGDAALRAVGTTAGTVAAGDDSRLADARTPTAHAASHATGQGDALTPGAIGAATAAQGVTSGDSHAHTGGAGAQIAYANLSGLPTLGTIASQSAASVAITGGTLTGVAITASSYDTSAADGDRWFAAANTADATTTGWGAGEKGRAWVNNTTGRLRWWDGAAAADLSGASTWGSITGTLSSQTDLQNALDAKAASSHSHAGSAITSGTVGAAYLPTNSDSSAGIVASGAGQVSKVWKTDGAGVPGWRDDAQGSGSYAVATSVVAGDSTLQAADFGPGGLEPLVVTAASVQTLPTAAADLYRPLLLGHASGTVTLRPPDATETLWYNGTAITAGYDLGCTAVGAYTLVGTAADTWRVFGPAAGCAEGSFYWTSLTPDPSSWDPADGTTATADATQDVTYTAAGSVVVSSASIVGGTNWTIDAANSTCDEAPSMVNGQTCVVRVVYNYDTEVTGDTATLRVASGSPSSPHDVALGPVTVTGGDVTPPTVTSATIGTNGTTLTLGTSETVTRSGGTFDVDCPSAQNIAATYSSGSGSSSLVYTLAQAVLQSDGTSCNLDYDGAANGIEDAAGNDLAAITNGAVTNNSTQVAPGYVLKDDQTGTLGSPLAPGVDAARLWASISWTSGVATYNLRRVQLALGSVGSISGKTYNVYIYNHDGSDPTTQVTNGATTVSGSSVTNSSGGLVTIDFASNVQIVNGNSYAIVVQAPSVDGANYLRVYSVTGGGTGRGEQDDDGVGTWTNYQSSVRPAFAAYAYE